MKSECIDYRNLPGQNPLFLDFLYRFDRISRFYSPMPASAQEWKERYHDVTGVRRFQRQLICDLLKQFSLQVAGGEDALANIRRLRDPETVAVVTGQQVGVLGGPSYSVYKAATAIQLTRNLREMGIPAVPIFWLAADDSDFDEVRTTQFFDRSGELFSVTHPDPRAKEERMAGTVRVAPPDQWLNGFDERVAPALAKGKWADLLRRNYTPGRPFREAFAAWLRDVFAGHGLIIFDPLIEGYRLQLQDFYAKAVEHREELIEISLKRSEDLHDSGYQPQVFVDETESFLFLLQGDRRYKLEFVNGSYRAKGYRGIRFNQKNLLRELRSGSIRVSPNVLLRPVLQDFLFPTIVSVVGPSEIAYYSQVNAISQCWNLSMAVYPRAAFTVVDRKSKRLLKKYGLVAAKILELSSDEIVEAVIRNASRSSALQNFDAVRRELQESLDELEESLRTQDESVADMLRKAREKILYQIEKVNRRYIANERLRDEHLSRHIDYLRSHLLPDGRLQERTINFNWLLAEGGSSFLEEIISVIQPDCLSHRVVYL